MKLSDDFVEKWEHIISSVNKTTVPLECIKKVIIKLEGRKRKTLKRQGLSIEEVETLLNRQLEEMGDEVVDLEFIVDVNAVAELVQPETNRILNNL